jgi:hypothetical protein
LWHIYLHSLRRKQRNSKGKNVNMKIKISNAPHAPPRPLPPKEEEITQASSLHATPTHWLCGISIPTFDSHHFMTR